MPFVSWGAHSSIRPCSPRKLALTELTAASQRRERSPVLGRYPFAERDARRQQPKLVGPGSLAFLADRERPASSTIRLRHFLTHSVLLAARPLLRGIAEIGKQGVARLLGNRDRTSIMPLCDKTTIALGVTLVVADGQSTCPSGSFARTDLNCIPISSTHDMRSVMPPRLPYVRRNDQLLRLVVDWGARRSFRCP